MPVLSISAEEANRNLRRTPASIWPDDRVPEDRLVGFAKVEARPSFGFSRADRILTMGSCFAREIEDRLDRLGFDLPLKRIELLPEDRTAKRHHDLANKYTIQSIENELRWAAGEPAPPPETLFLETLDGLWHDPQLFQAATSLPIERVAERRALFQKSVAEFPACRIVIVTLGLAEAWFDQETSLYLNASPPAAAVRRHPGRFRFDILSYDDILGSMERIYEILKAKGHPDFRMLVTVSPVPLKATFGGEDALSANSYSKAVQRAACREFVARRPEADYFPSYEIVALSPRELAYEQDNIHVAASLVDHIMNQVFLAYAPDLATGAPRVQAPLTRRDGALARPADMFRVIKHHLREAAYAEASAACEDCLDRSGPAMSPKDRATIKRLWGSSLALLERWAEAAALLEEAVAVEPGDGGADYRLGQCLLKLDRTPEALAAFERAVALDPSRPEFRTGLERARAVAPGLDAPAHPAFDEAL